MIIIIVANNNNYNSYYTISIGAQNVILYSRLIN